MTEIVETSTGYILKVTHNCGFYSNCTMILNFIIKHFNEKKQLPIIIDTTNSFTWYKSIEHIQNDIKHIYVTENTDININHTNDIFISNEEDINFRYTGNVQYIDYKTINYFDILPFVHKYFSPSNTIRDHVHSIQSKYNIDYENTCVLFYRGNDKVTEWYLPDYEKFINTGKQILINNPTIQFLIQSDETEFLNVMKQNFPNSIILNDEIRHINRSRTSVDHVYRDTNTIKSQLFMAIQLIMSKCKYFICTTGNCSFWVALFRENGDNIVQINS